LKANVTDAISIMLYCGIKYWPLRNIKCLLVNANRVFRKMRSIRRADNEISGEELVMID
jgi:hypothetical protein